MGYPVVHFEINTHAAAELRSFYARAFDWKIDGDPDDYAFVDTEGVCAGSGEPGINGAIGHAPPGEVDFVTFYVQVPDLGAALARVEQLGGTIVVQPTQVPDGVTYALFRDPMGNRIGLVRA